VITAGRNYPVLKKDALPSKNLPCTSFSAKKPVEDSARAARSAKRLAAKFNTVVDDHQSENILESSTVAEADPGVEIGGEAVVDVCANLDRDEAINEVLCRSKSTQTIPLVEHDASCQTTPPQTKDVACEANTQKFSLLSLIKSDHTLKIWTGLDGFSTLHTLTKIVSQVEGCRGPKRLLLDVKERIVMTLIVIRHGIQYNLLSTLFGVAQSTISRHFHATLLSLAEGLHSLIYWPTNEENIKSMPVYFIGHFEDTKVVLDCTECKIEMFKCLKCRIESYSNYKSSHTAKYLLGVTPCGTFSYVSRGYPGRASDKYIFNKENVAALLAPGVDAVMIDKGFSIETELSNAGKLRFSHNKPRFQLNCFFS
jgi:DDE superfamily endonuclease/Helix-turn-helix of DDE superfamily endonuclease